ncbi:hypothetical protein ACS0TY_015614 [Phlomoides rotata]
MRKPQKAQGGYTAEDFSVFQKIIRLNIRGQNPMYYNNPAPIGLKRKRSTLDLKRVHNGLILTSQVSIHVGGIIVHGKTYSKDRDSGQNILSLMYLVNIRDFGHSNEQTPLMLTDGTSLEPSPQSVLLHQLQRPDKGVFTYIKQQETKPALVVNLTEDEISTRRA